MFPWPGGAGTRRLGSPPPQVPLAISTSRGLSAPPSMSLQSPSQVALAMGVLAVALPHSHGQLAQSFNPFFKHVSGHQHLLVGLPGLSEFAVVEVVLSWSSLWNLILVVGHKGSGGSPF